MKDRKDGKRVPITGLMQCCIDLKPGRMENEVYLNTKMDVTPLCEFVEKCAAEGVKYSYFQAFVAAIAKVLYARPRLNRFICNRHLYEHNDVTISFVAKMSLDDKSEEIMLVIPVDGDDNIDTIAEKVAKKVENLRGKSVTKKGANSAIDVLGKLPNFFRVPIFGIIKGLAEKGHLPTSLMKDNIYFSSMIVTNLGSIRCGAIYHNLANFGTCSSLAAIGEIVPEKRVDAQGNERLIRTCEFGITLDERIADGFYFAKSAKQIEYVLQHPYLLKQKVSDPIEAQG